MSTRAVVATSPPLRVGHLVAASIAVAVIVVLLAFCLGFGLSISASRVPRAVAIDAGPG